MKRPYRAASNGCNMPVSRLGGVMPTAPIRDLSEGSPQLPVELKIFFTTSDWRRAGIFFLRIAPGLVVQPDDSQARSPLPTKFLKYMSFYCAAKYGPGSDFAPSRTTKSQARKAVERLRNRLDEPSVFGSPSLLRKRNKTAASQRKTRPCGRVQNARNPTLMQPGVGLRRQAERAPTRCARRDTLREAVFL